MVKFFIDTGDISKVEEYKKLGIFDGVTTNPMLVTKEGGDMRKDFKEFNLKMLNVAGDIPVSIEVTCNDYDGMVKEAHELARLGKNVVIKIPMHKDGIIACKTLTDEGIKVNVTACMNARQCLIAASAGATYASIFFARVYDMGYDPVPIIREAVTFLDEHNANKRFDRRTDLIVGSLRSLYDIDQAIRSGAHILTVPYRFIDGMIYHVRTEETINEFLKNWQDDRKIKN